jgi:teichuronic acid biosynthesis glycosyltransferase TuaC
MARPDLIRFLPDNETAAEQDLRVLFVTNMWPDEERPYYGSFIASQAGSLRRRSVGVDVLYVRGYVSNRAYATALRAIPRQAATGHYDVVHAHYGYTVAASIAVRGRPLVASFCGDDLLGIRREVAISRRAARRATCTITKSSEMELVLPEALRARNHVLPNGVDTQTFAPRSRAAARAELGWAPDGKVMLFLGDPANPRKNADLARRAAALVQERVPGARLEMPYGLAPDRIPVLMNAADCLVFPSTYEGSPNVVKEAMASALPIVATPVGDVRERLTGVAGCFVRPADPAAFAEAIEQALAAGASPAAREAVQALSIEAVAERLVGIYRGAIDGA